MSPELLKKTDRYKNILSLLEESELCLFISTFIRRFNPLTRFYWIYLGMIISTFVVLINLNSLAALESRVWIVGLLGGLLVVLITTSILHGFIQASFLKKLGSSIVNLTWSWKRMSMKVNAPNFAISKKSFYRMSFIPFILFSIAPLFISIFTSEYWFFLSISTAFFHALFCMKDFALLSYLYQHKNSYLYHELDGNKTLIYKAIE
jgi:hypothetical protein